MTQTLDPVIRDQVVARLRQGEKAGPIADALKIGLSTVYGIAKAEGVGNIRRMGPRKNGTTTLTLPEHPGGERVGLALSESEFAKLAGNPRSEAVLVAGMIQSDSLRARVLSLLGNEGPFKNIEELANSLRRKTDNFGYHELTTIIKHLRKQGLVSIKESKRVTAGNTDSHPTNIELTLQGREHLGITTRPIVERVLAMLCRDGGCASDVRLAADLWEGAQDNATTLRVTAALQLLNGRGHVVYKLGPNGTLIDIKPTESGYQEAGFPVPGRSREGIRGQKVAGTSRAGHAVGKDMTEKRHHLPWATGGEIIREPLNPDHRELFPHHDHDGAKPTISAPQASVEPEAAAKQSPVLPKGNYPLLDGLVREYVRVKENEEKAMKLLEAADLLATVDPEQAKILSDRAEEVIGKAFSPLEAEFLRYAEEHS